MDRLIKMFCLALLGVFAFSSLGLAYDEDDDYDFYEEFEDVAAPTRSQNFGWKEEALSRQLSLGIELAHRLGYSYTDPSGQSTDWKPGVNDITWFGGFSLRYFFNQSNFGIGIEGLVMDIDVIQGSSTLISSGSYSGGYYTQILVNNTETTIIKWLVDLDLLFRYPIIPNLSINGGVGLTFDMVTWTTTRNGIEEDSDFDIGKLGFNFKVGAEYYLDSVWSVSLDWKWQTWKTAYGQEKYTIHSLLAGVHLSF